MRFAAPTDPDVLREGMDRSMSAMAVASTECLQSVADFDQRKLWRADGATSMSSWLAARYGLAWGTAREWVRVAHALRGLPGITQAYATGKLSWDQLRPLTKFATPETDDAWVRKAPHSGPPPCGERPPATSRPGPGTPRMPTGTGICG